MITFTNISTEKPYQHWMEMYNEASKKNQYSIEAAAISSWNNASNEVDSRFVNIKYINHNQWIFFSNYSSQKASQFASHDQISVLFYWPSNQSQIRIKAKIFKSDSVLSDQHFSMRSDEKNALAISSDQSSPAKSYEDVVLKYDKALKNSDLSDRPDYWGGYSFTPYYFEFWKGHDSRLNMRDVYEIKDDDWHHSVVQP